MPDEHMVQTYSFQTANDAGADRIRLGARMGDLNSLIPELAATAQQYCQHPRIARPYKKNEQAYIESFNRSLRKECLGWAKYRAKDLSGLTAQVEDWLRYYQYERPHISLGMRLPLVEQV
jgi:transposase InsO family protein